MCLLADIVLARMDAERDMASKEAEESKIPQVVSAYADKRNLITERTKRERLFDKNLSRRRFATERKPS